MINFACQGVVGQTTFIGPQAHTPPLATISTLTGHIVDNKCSGTFKFLGSRILNANNIASKFNNGQLQSETNSKEGNFVGSSMFDCTNFSFHSPLAKTSW